MCIDAVNNNVFSAKITSDFLPLFLPLFKQYTIKIMKDNENNSI